MTNSSLSGRRVLVVEDEIMVAWLLEDMLTNLGCTVVGPAARIDQALALIDAEGFDAAVLDLNLNGTKSYPVADALAAHGVPFAFSSGHSQDSLPDGYRNCAMLHKPFRRSDLGDMLGKLLMLRESNDGEGK
jgi:DNA-binding NtrC family response regulator